MSDGWTRAAAAILMSPAEAATARDPVRRDPPETELPSGVTPPGRERMNPAGRPSGIDALPEFAPVGQRPVLVIVDRFDLRMVDMNVTGARLHVLPLPRADALELVARYSPEVVATNDRAAQAIEKDLGIDVPRPKVQHGTRLLVVDAIRWNDVRYTLVTYESDGDGCVE